ncbi:DNA-binding protein RFX8 isoform X2 [Cuculus canorus]|uniref:DNA-binding protein RFX8 isoform X2 n=1 Tax=Cuculus canorus TaxID=55661 RepID=UPI0023AAAE5D|nr:DNA-binding protein RFX8 isoform X2 [Cuculus canorus]
MPKRHLVRLVFPGLRTRRLGKRGSTRYHYDGIAIKSSSSFYARYCSLLSENNHHRTSTPGEASSSTQQLSTYAITSRNVCGSGDAPGYRSNSQKIRTSETLHCFPTVIYLKTEQETPWPELSSYCLWEQDMGKKYPYEMIALIANEYYSHCQDILHMVRNSQFNKVERCIMSFWRSLQPEGIALMCLPGVCKLFKSYDRQLFKEIENILFHDFLEEVSIQHVKSVTLFSENIQVWLLNALEEFPLLIQTSKSEEVTLFIKRLRRKIDLSSMAETMRKILNSNNKVTALRSNLHAIINQGLLEMPGNIFETNCKNPEELQIDIGVKCLNDLLPLLAPYTDIRVLLSCMSSNLQAFVIKPSRSKEEFRKLASDFQLRWNFLLSAVSKAMTLNCGHSFAQPLHGWCRSVIRGTVQLVFCKAASSKNAPSVRANGSSTALSAPPSLQQMCLYIPPS